MSTIEWFPLHRHDSYSLLDSIVNPVDLAERCVELGYAGAAMTDHGSVSGAAGFASAMKDKGLRALNGCEIYVSKHPSTEKNKDNRKNAHLCVLAKNLKGWKQLLGLVSRSNEKERVYYGKPRLQLAELADFTQGGDLIAFSGHPGSEVADVIFKDASAAYKASSYEEVRAYHIHEDASNRLLRLIEQYIAVFGRENFFLEVQILDPEVLPASIAIAKAVRWASIKTGIPCVATADTHYVRREDAYDQRVVLCKNLRTSLQRVQAKLDANEDVTLGGFFKSNNFHLPSVEEMLVHHTEEEVRQSVRIADMIEDYSILSKPRIPTYPLTGGMTQEGYLRELCRQGWDRLIKDNPLLQHSEEVYQDRLDMELQVIEGAKLSGYFNIVQHGRKFSLDRGRWLGRSRGSAGGCLISFLSGITATDPVKYDLDFTRFYNDGRNTEDHVSLPDIDLDFPKDERRHVFREYQRVFGEDRVGKISTFSKLAGRSAIEAVLDAHGIPFEVRKQITAVIPDKAKIAEELEEMKKDGGKSSILLYALEVYGDELSEWVTRNDDGSLSGEFAHHFEQAIRLEGVKSVRSTHAAGVVISDLPLREVAPLRWDSEEEAWVADMEYEQLESMGLVKLDVLGVQMLDKIEGVRSLARTGKL